MTEGPFHAGHACEDHLLDAVSRGNEGAFWTLWHRHRPHLYGVCLRRMSGMTADADDALSRSMFVARRKLTAYGPRIVNLEAWLTRMASNVCADLRRQQRRREQGAVSLDQVTNSDHPGSRCRRPRKSARRGRSA